MFSFVMSKLQCYGNYVLENYGVVAVALAIILFTTILVVKYKNFIKMSTTDACILCTINEKERETGKYWIHIDVVQKKKADDMLKQRSKEGYTAKTAGFGGGISQPFKVGDDDIITFGIEEALKPATKFKEGQDRLKCKNIKNNICSREIFLVPDEDRSENLGTITFWHEGEFLHQVTISDVKQASTISNSLSCSGTAASLGIEAVTIPTTPKQGFELDGLARMEEKGSDAVDGNTIITTTSTTTQSSRLTESTRFTTEIPRVFSSKSLHVLSDALGRDAERLLLHLNIGDVSIKTELNNYPRNCAQAYANLFMRWQKKEIHRGKDFMCKEMAKCLQDIGRNDIKMKFMEFVREDTELTADHFKE